MVRIEFHNPTKIVIHGEECEALICDALFSFELEYYHHLFFGAFDDNKMIPKFKIKSITEIKEL